MRRSLTSHIESNPAKCGGKPCIADTRIRVWDIHVWHDLRGQSPEEIVASFPQLTLSDVHAALAYYLDHRQEIENQMRDVDASVSRLEADQEPTRFSRLRRELLKGDTGHDDSVSPG